MKKCSINAENWSKKVASIVKTVNNHALYQHGLWLEKLGIKAGSKVAWKLSRAKKHHDSSSDFESDMPTTSLSSKSNRRVKFSSPAPASPLPNLTLTLDEPPQPLEAQRQVSDGRSFGSGATASDNCIL